MLKCWSGVRSPSFPPSRIKCHHLQVHQTGTLGVKSARNLQDWSPRGGGGGGEQGAGGSRLRGDSAWNPLPRDLALGPQPQKGPCPPRGRALFPRPAPALQLCVPRRVGCRISSQALAACSVFPNPLVGEGGSLVRIRVPPPLPLSAPWSSLEFPVPAAFQTPFPFRPWPQRPLAPPLLDPKFQVQVGGGQVDSTILARRCKSLALPADPETCGAPA